MLQFNVLQRDGRVNLWIKQLQKKKKNTKIQILNQPSIVMTTNYMYMYYVFR